MRQYSLLIIIFMLMAAAIFLNIACNDQKSEPPNRGQVTTEPPEEEPAPPEPEPLTPEQIAERKKIAESVKTAFEAKSYSIKKTAEGAILSGPSLGESRVSDGATNSTIAISGWVFIINLKEKATVEITAPGVGTASFKFDNFGNLEPLIE
ncbi:MAG: hypothetical protein OXU23_26420 [Candidatus Poribacteria bacterium]|nr:hypothetical protein [Candidatus Poribacteria bacterium]